MTGTKDKLGLLPTSKWGGRAQGKVGRPASLETGVRERTLAKARP